MQLFIGFFYYIRGILYLIFHPQLWPYLIIPSILSLISFQTLLWITNFKKIDLEQELQGTTTLINNWLVRGSLQGVVVFFTLIISFLVFMLINLLSTPAQRALSSKTEEVLLGKVQKPKPSGSLLSRFFGKLFFWIKRIFSGIFFLILGFVPVIGQAAMAYWTSRQAGWNYLDVSMERHGWSALEKENKVKSCHWMMIGFGAACVLVLVLPISLNKEIQLPTSLYGVLNTVIGALAVPWSVVGATLLHLEKIVPASTANVKKH